LLLTFFFRQMPELIERGHLYIAQPPLYKVARGKSSRYLKDQAALEDYLITSGLEEAALEVASGEVRAGLDLRSVVDDALRLRTLLDGLHSRYNRSLVEQAAIAGALSAETFADPTQAAALATQVAERMDMISDETERGWSGKVTDTGGLLLERVVRGVTEIALLDAALLASQDAQAIHQLNERLKDVYDKPATLRRKAAVEIIGGPMALLESVFSMGRKGLTDIQRYKGLGEMNADQLWETTLDPNVRSLLQVRISDAVNADDLFSRLMGDEVEPRREFIQDNALSVANLDI
jgi:DNA gyrase subunit B